MADPIKAKFDTSGWERGLQQLLGPARISLARTMAVAGGRVLRDEAKVLAPVGTLEEGSIYPGALRDAIYVAYKPARSIDSAQVYSVSWNAKKAPHGHLLEFGHWRTNVSYTGKDGEWYSNPNVKLPKPVWIPGHAFLRRSLGAMDRARAAMMDAGRKRLFELLADPTADEEVPNG
ncbi:HK97 gp10 family phage protein [Dyella marensis]|uniref:HK97 gp10 family phage protein n=1 Tax=Dyella marensis TaxID=500610 RepID=A0A1I1ZY32_9GAMM|nr:MULTISPECIES: HK97 gp10 family phage protein [Dyella]SFE36529.1 hypothetical protein SAMN02799615_00852 [Dyella marensis]